MTLASDRGIDINQGTTDQSWWELPRSVVLLSSCESINGNNNSNDNNRATSFEISTHLLVVRGFTTIPTIKRLVRCAAAAIVGEKNHGDATIPETAKGQYHYSDC